MELGSALHNPPQHATRVHHGLPAAPLDPAHWCFVVICMYYPSLIILAHIPCQCSCTLLSFSTSSHDAMTLLHLTLDTLVACFSFKLFHGLKTTTVTCCSLFHPDWKMSIATQQHIWSRSTESTLVDLKLARSTTAWSSLSQTKVPIKLCWRTLDHSMLHKPHTPRYHLYERRTDILLPITIDPAVCSADPFTSFLAHDAVRVFLRQGSNRAGDKLRDTRGSRGSRSQSLCNLTLAGIAAEQRLTPPLLAVQPLFLDGLGRRINQN